MTIKFKYLYSLTTDHGTLKLGCRYNMNDDTIIIKEDFCYPRGYSGGSINNKTCAAWLGIRAEIILANLFKKVKKMTYSNPGFDFLCGKGYKIDVKCSCLTVKYKAWKFNINHNKIADFFLCLALNNRDDLDPFHIWLIPGDVINQFSGLTISESTLDKWSEYEQSLDKVIQCCDMMKNNNLSNNRKVYIG